MTIHGLRAKRGMTSRSRTRYSYKGVTKFVRPAVLLLAGGLALVAMRTSVTLTTPNVHDAVENAAPWIEPKSTLPFNRDNVAHDARNLIVVAGHSVTVSGHLRDANHDEHDWFLLDYQKHQGLPDAIVAHIAAGIEMAAADVTALLVFSGGATRVWTGPETEGASYFRVADAMQLWTHNVRARTVAEEFATDSFENLLFSICRFYEVTGRYPGRITVVSFSFKQTRFEHLHAAALRWPPTRFVYVGVDPPAATGFDVVRATQGERQNAAVPFTTDPYGCHSQILRDKRAARNPFFRTPPYAVSCKGMQALLQYCGPALIDAGQVPW